MARAGIAKTKLVNGERINIATGLPMTSSAITSATLSPQTSFNLTPPKPSTKAEGMTAGFEVGADQFTKNLERERSEAAKLRESSLGGYTDALASQLTESGATAQAYGQKGGVDDIQTELDAINSQLLQEQNANRRRIEAIDKNAPGMLRSQVEAEKQRINTESLRRQADLSIIQMGIQGRFDSAKAIADRAVDAILEGEKNRLEALRVNYEENKDLFDKADQRAFETAQGDRERKLQNEEYRLRAEFDQKIKQADPLYQLQIQKTQKELQLLGQESPTERAKREKEDAAALKEAQASIPVMRDKLDLVDVLKQHPGMAGSVGAYGISRFTPFTPDKSARQEFLGGVQKLVGGMTLDNLITAKERGATFGALSDAELSILAASASAINTWAIRDENDQITGYEIGEAEFKKELDNIQTLTRRAMELSGASLIADDEEALLDQLYQEVVPVNPASYY